MNNVKNYKGDKRMKGKLIKMLTISLVSLVLGLMGSLVFAAERELTPVEFAKLSPKEQKEYRTVVVKVHSDFHCFWYMPPEKGVWDSAWEEIVHSGDILTATGTLIQTLFEIEHPKVKIEITRAQYWKPSLQANLAAGTAPAIYGAGGLPGTIDEGIYADITDLVKNWDKAAGIPMSLWQNAWKDGRCYARPEKGVWRAGAIELRKDWFKEAGIFNKYGEPLPEDNWTFSDFREIAKKLTDPKKKRWGYAYSPNSAYSGDHFQDLGRNFAHGISYAIPDKTGKYTWRFNTNPQIAETLRWLGDMRFKDKSLLIGKSAGESHGAFNSSRAAMYLFEYGLGLRIGCRTTFSETVPRRFFSGFALYPQGPYGLRRGCPSLQLSALNPTLSKEQLKAAFEFMDFTLYGKGEWYYAQAGVDAYLAGLPILNQPEVRGPVPLPVFKQALKEVVGNPKESDLYTPDQLRKRSLIFTVPEVPFPHIYGIPLKTPKDYESALTAMYSKAVTDPNCDYQAAVNEAADVINKTVWNYKIKGDKEKFKEYYTALGKFYKEHYPEFYEKEWPKLLEKYYKVW